MQFVVYKAVKPHYCNLYIFIETECHLRSASGCRTSITPAIHQQAEEPVTTIPVQAIICLCKIYSCFYNEYMCLCKIHYYFISGLSLDITHLCNRTTMISLLLIREDVEKVFATIILQLRN